MAFTKNTLFMSLAIAQVISLNSVEATFAKPLTLKVYPSNSRDTFPICPTEITLEEKSRPYYEGGYTIDGEAKLGWLTRNFKIASSDEFSVTWVAKLQIKYHNCQATAGIASVDNEPFRGHSYLRMRFVNGNAYLILDMTAMYDANRLTPVILKKEVKDGNPTWTWAGTD